MGCFSTRTLQHSFSLQAHTAHNKNPNSQQYISILQKTSLLKAIENNIQIIQNLLYLIIKSQNRQIKGLSIIFRASEHQHRATAFHEICDNKTRTLLIAKTMKNSIFGGYTPCPWKNNQLLSYQADKERKSFVFCIQKNKVQHYPLKEQYKDYAIMNDMDRGPIFGKGHDIIIHDRSDKHENWNNLGMSYESSYKFGSKKANMQLANEQKFLMNQYQIWQVQFQ